MPRRTTRSSQNQSTSQSTNRSQLSQSKLDQHFALSQISLEEQVNNCVRYFVNNAGQQVFFRKADVKKYCLPKSGQNLEQVIEQATQILNKVYGYNVLVCDQSASSGKAYVVSNRLPYLNYNINKDVVEDKDVKKILLLLILTHLYMSNASVSEGSLHSFLKSFNIDVNIRHPVFGLVKEYITTLVKKKFILMETDAVSKKVTFSWGIRAEKEVSKHEILKFVCKMFKDRQPKSWTDQFRAAEQQGFENEQLASADRMEEE